MDVCEGVPQGLARVFVDGEEFPNVVEVCIGTGPLTVRIRKATDDSSEGALEFTLRAADEKG